MTTPISNRPRYRKKNSLASILLTYALLISGALLTVLPLIFSIATSLRTERDLLQRGALSWPGEVTLGTISSSSPSTISSSRSRSPFRWCW